MADWQALGGPLATTDLELRDDGDRLRVRLADQLPETTLTVAGVNVLIAALVAWVTHHTDYPEKESS